MHNKKSPYGSARRMLKRAELKTWRTGRDVIVPLIKAGKREEAKVALSAVTASWAATAAAAAADPNLARIPEVQERAAAMLERAEGVEAAFSVSDEAMAEQMTELVADIAPSHTLVDQITADALGLVYAKGEDKEEVMLDMGMQVVDALRTLFAG